jgi:hypothetical protein
VVAEIVNSKNAKARLRILGDMWALLPDANWATITAEIAIAIGVPQLTSDHIL